jgi:hypothetical protein
LNNGPEKINFFSGPFYFHKEDIMSTSLKDKDNELWYKVTYGENEELIFPVSIDDVGNATMMKEDKALFFMRYIRKYLKVLAEIG